MSKQNTNVEGATVSFAITNTMLAVVTFFHDDNH
jgi:hypothetical protein